MAASALARSGLGIQLVGLLLHIIGLATPEWSAILDGFSTVTYGLWQECFGAQCAGMSREGKEYYDGKLEAAEAFAIIGMLAAIIATVAAGLCVFLPMWGLEVKAPLHIVSMVAAFFAAGCVGICVIFWVLSVHDELGKRVDSAQKTPTAFSFDDFDEHLEFGYSFFLSIIGGIFFLIGGPILFAGGRLMAT